jgi:hypothetical protein
MVRRGAVWVPNWADGYGTISIETAPTVNRRDWLYCFGKLLGAARAIQECVKGKRKIAAVGNRPSPLCCLLTAQIVCSRFVKAHHQQLRGTRMSLPTPPEYSFLIGKSYCEYAVDLISGWQNLFNMFVQHDNDSIKLEGQERVAFEVRQIVSRWNEVSMSPTSWFSSNLKIVVRFVEMEIDHSKWMTDVQPRTEKENEIRTLLRLIIEQNPDWTAKGVLKEFRKRRKQQGKEGIKETDGLRVVRELRRKKN